MRLGGTDLLLLHTVGINPTVANFAVVARQAINVITMLISTEIVIYLWVEVAYSLRITIFTVVQGSEGLKQ